MIVVVALEEASPNAAITVHWLTNLLRRMGHQVHLPIDDRLRLAGRLPQEVLTDLADLPPTTPSSRTVPVVIGRRRRPGAINVWSDGWTIWVNADATPAWRDFNPVSAAAAACLAAAFVHGAKPERPGFTFNLLTYNAESTPGALDVGTPIPEFTLAGVGAVGSSLCLVLSYVGLTAPCRLVDNQELDGGNVIRYVLAQPCDVGQPKAEVAARRLGPLAQPVHGSITDHLTPAPNILVCAVHDAETRHSIAAYLPSHTIDGAIGDSMDGTTARVEICHATFPPDGPCLACFYQVPGRDQQLANRLGITVAELDELVTPVMRQAIETHNGCRLPASVLGMRARDVAPEFCGSEPTLEPATPDLRAQRIFGPALAGTFLAAELIKVGLGRPTLNNLLRWDILHPLTAHHVRRNSPLPDCPNCTDPDLIAHVNRRTANKG